MASQVLSGASNPSYTNNTGQNVRIVINYMSGTATGISLNWAGVSVSAALAAIGRNLAFVSAAGTIEEYPFREGIALPPGSVTGFSISANNANSLPTPTRTTVGTTGGNQTQFVVNTPTRGSLPLELMLTSGQTFSAVCGAYNIVVIPEAG